MVDDGSPPSSSGGRAAIEHMLQAATPFAQVEGAIEATDLTPDEKAALWVLAWSASDRDMSGHPELERRLAPAG
jgi:hypothetical protein